MVLREIVTKVVLSWLPVNADVDLVHLVWYPMEAHVHGFGALEFGGAVCKSTGCGIVSGDACGARLWVPHFLEDRSEEHSFLAVVEQGSHFGFCCGGHDIFQNTSFNVDGSVGFGDFGRLVKMLEQITTCP